MACYVAYIFQHVFHQPRHIPRTPFEGSVTSYEPVPTPKISITLTEVRLEMFAVKWKKLQVTT